MNNEILGGNEVWETVERPGYLGSHKEEFEKKWDELYGFNNIGDKNWRVSWETRDGKELSFERIFSEYVSGYSQHFRKNPEVLNYLIENSCFTYDIDPSITREQAFDPKALVGIPGIPNQFHHVAINIAIEEELGLQFKGEAPIQVRGLKKTVPLEEWSIIALLQPGFIKCLHSNLIRIPDKLIWWINPDSIEGLYQYCKVVQRRVN